MKTNRLFYLALIIPILLSLSCNMSEDRLSVSTMDSHSKLVFKAAYPKEKTRKLKNYLDSVLNQNVPINENIDLFVKLEGGDKFELKASTGFLEIVFDKEQSAENNYLKVKRLTEKISTVLTKN